MPVTLVENDTVVSRIFRITQNNLFTHKAIETHTAT